MIQRTHCDDVDRIKNNVKGYPQKHFVFPKGEYDQVDKLESGHEDTPRYYEIEQPMNDTLCTVATKLGKATRLRIKF